MPLSFFSSGVGSGSQVPFQRMADSQALGAFLNLDQAELLRIQRYAESWKFYFGKHWSFRREDGEPLVTINYFRKIIDKVNAFLMGKGFHIKVPDSLEEVTKPFLDEVWEYNAREKTADEMGVMGGVTGDVFLLVTYEDPTPLQRRINPYSQGHVRVNLLGSEQVYPTWDPLNKDTLLSVRIETVYYADTGGAFSVDRPGPEGRRLDTRRFTQILTPDQIIEQFHGEPPTMRPNVLGEIPLVHIQNLPVPREYYGLPDAMDILDLQRELNEKATDISDIVNYHCVDTNTEVLTYGGWKHYDELHVGDKILCLDPTTDEIVWQPVQAVNIHEYTGSLVLWDNRVDAVTTPNHRWLAERRVGRPENRRYVRQFVRTSEAEGGDLAAREMGQGSRIILGGGTPAHFPAKPTYDDELVETIGWFVTEGSVATLPSGSKISYLAQSEVVNPEFVAAIRRVQAYWVRRGETFTEQGTRPDGVVCWYLGTALTAALLDVAPEKSLLPKFLTSLTYHQAERLFTVLLDADGTRSPTGREVWYQDDRGRIAGFQMLAAMVKGARSRAFVDTRGNGVVHLMQTRTVEVLSTVNSAKELAPRTTTVWCPTVAAGVWFARRCGYTYWTGNSSPVTIITGAKAKQVEKGPKQIWSGLPEKANVYTLKLEGDLVAARGYLDFIKKALHELSDVPEGSLGTMQPISNTSGVALHMQYQPLLEKRKRKSVQYAAGLEQVNYFILRIGMTQGLLHLPFDLCSKCGGRVIEVQSDKLTKVWNPELQQYVDVPLRKKKCYHIDKQTLEFTDPEDMRLKMWRQYGFGQEIREMPFGQIVDEVETGERSFWDYGVYQEQKQQEWLAKNQAQLAQLTAPPPQDPTLAAVDPAAAVQAQGEAATAAQSALPPHVQSTMQQAAVPPLPLAQQTATLPVSEIDVPEEPEHVTVLRQWLHPDTGELALEETQTLFLVPTGCRRPAYLNPFKNEVEFPDPLPKDEALQAQLYFQYQQAGWVDEEWVRQRIPEIAASSLDIERRMKARDAAEKQLNPATVAEYGGVKQTVYQENAPPTGPQATIPGPGGNPIGIHEQAQKG